MTTNQKTALRDACGESEWDELLTAVGENFNPEDVFSKDSLTVWAEENGFVLTE